MKKVIFIFMVSCMGCSQPIKEEREIIILDTNLEYREINVDSVVKEAKQSVINYKDHITTNKKNVDSLATLLVSNKNLSTHQKQKYLEDINTMQSQSQLYQNELQGYKEKRVVTEDSIIYRVKYRDTIIYQRQTVTIFDTITQTHIKEKKGKRKRKKQ